MPLEQVSEAIVQVRRRIVRASLAAALLSLGAAYLTSRPLSRRIRQVQLFADGPANARFPETLPPEPDEEPGAPARSLESMSNQFRDMLERLERVRRGFPANVSHELRTPLAAIQGYAETLLEGGLEDQEHNRRFVEIIQAHAVRLNNIASGLLASSAGTFASDPPRLPFPDPAERLAGPALARLRTGPDAQLPGRPASTRDPERIAVHGRARRRPVAVSSSTAGYPDERGGWLARSPASEVLG